MATLLETLERTRTTPLDQLDTEDVYAVVEEIRRRDEDDDSVDVARFGSSI